MVSTGASSVGGDEIDAKEDDDVMVPSREMLEKWASAIQTLVKGKVRLGHEVSTNKSYSSRYKGPCK